MITKILIIGFGSIGEKHYNILKELKSNFDIRVITSRKLKKNIRKINYNIYELTNFNPDYIVISSKTSQHYEDLKKINSIFKKKIILVEKPLFHKKKKFKKKKNKIFIAYNLRFNPILIYLKKIIKKEKKDLLLNANVYCGSYLPNWRKNLNYTKSYSSFKNLGGGVYNDLSHEIDYLHWIFGKIRTKYFCLDKISNLKIFSEDTCLIIGELKNKINSKININLNYYSKIPHRFMILDFLNKTIHVDLINNFIKVKYLKKKIIKINYKNFNKNFTYISMHRSIIKGSYKNLCTFNEGYDYLQN